MDLAGRRTGFAHDYILISAVVIGMMKRRALARVEEVGETVRAWERHAEAAGIPPGDAARIEGAFRSTLISG